MTRFLSLIVGPVMLLASFNACLAQTLDYPSKAVNVTVAFPPGTPNDFIVRLISDPFRGAMSQAIIAENRAGAGGNIAAEYVSKGPSDGYLLLAAIDTVVSVNPHIYRNLGYKPEIDLIPIIYLANTAQTLVCHPSVPVQTVLDFVAYAKSRDLNFASGGQGTPGHMAAELFIEATGIKMTHIPYKGPGAAAQDLMAGVVPCGFLATPVVMPQVKAGKLKALGVTSSKRVPIAPEVPTIAQAGVPGYDAAFGEVLFAPRGTPATVIQRLNEVIGALLMQPAIRERMLAADLEFLPNTPAQAAQRLTSESLKWQKVVSRVGMRVD
jgi:tripartite-type tricarboxylate transporter receptor subunit TctC